MSAHPLATASGTERAPHTPAIIFRNVSRFYGDVLGVNRVNLSIGPGITSLVGPNGSGKSTLMNLMAGLIQPSEGLVEVMGISPRDPERLFRVLGYCTQFDSFPRGMTGFQFVRSTLRFHGLSVAHAEARAWEAIQRVRLEDAAHRKVGAYSKGMRQRIRLAQALAHRPRVVVLDEPLNGLDPMARAETIAIFKALGAEGLFVIVSSHILHEVDEISDRVILINQGYILAEGEIRGVRSEVTHQPAQILVRCGNRRALAQHMMGHPTVVEARLLPDDASVLFRASDADQFYAAFQAAVLALKLEVQQLRPTDEDADSLYQYLIGETGGVS
ncbi:MAG: ABC transporter ATP-binding protein [Bryobacterales bacterium]|jgi:ABC-2 type transport system ATP-binding protein|nr:ABC transporter ATP-binding protein [Bryobacterales bacterium]